MASVARNPVVGRNMLTRPKVERRTVDPVISQHFRQVFEKKLMAKVPDNDYHRLTAAGSLTFLGIFLVSVEKLGIHF